MFIQVPYNQIEGVRAVRNIEIQLEVMLELDEMWASNQTADELIDYIRDRMDSSLGFRGQIRSLNVVS